MLYSWAILFFFAPVGLLLSPILIPSVSTLVTWNAVSGSSFDPINVVKLVKAIAEHIIFTLFMIPVMLPRLWSYVKNDATYGAPVRKNIPYEDEVQGLVMNDDKYVKHSSTTTVSRPLLDVYPIATNNNRLRPVILFIYGGAFTSGDKTYYYRFACTVRQQCDAVVAVPNYNLYPTADINRISESVASAVAWVHANIERYGGDKNNIWLVGHSAGAHLATHAVLRTMMAKSSDSLSMPSALSTKEPVSKPRRLLGWPYFTNSSLRVLLPDSDAAPNPSHNPSKPAVDFRRIPTVTGLVLFSGVYDIRAHIRSHEVGRGIVAFASTEAVTGGYMNAVSPVEIVKAMTTDPITYSLRPDVCPPRGFHIVHSPNDTTVDISQSNAFYEVLAKLQSAVPTTMKFPYFSPTRVRLLPSSVSHSDVVLGPMKQSTDRHPTVAALLDAMYAYY